MKECDRACGCKKVHTSSSVISEASPVLEPRDRVFDACAASTMDPPHSISDDSPTAKTRRDELADATVATIREHSSMTAAQFLDLRAAGVDRIVAVAGTRSGDADDLQICTPNEQLEIAGPSIVLRFCGD